MSRVNNIAVLYVDGSLKYKGEGPYEKSHQVTVLTIFCKI